MDINTKIFKAVQAENVSEVKILLEAGADANSYFQHDDGFDGTLLHYTQSGKVAYELLRHGAFVDSRDWYASTPLFLAVQRGSLDVVKVLLNNNASINAVDGFGENILNRAIRCYKGNLEIIRELLKHGVSLNGDIWNPFPPLHIAVINNQLDIIDELLKQGACIEQRDSNDSTVLHVALQNSSIKMSTITNLLENGADVNKVHISSSFPLDIAVSMGNVHVVRELLKYGANVCLVDEYHESSLYKALANSPPIDITIINELLIHGAKAGSYLTFTKEKSPVHYAVSNHIEGTPISPELKLLLKYSTVDYLDVYEDYTTIQLKNVLGQVSDFAIDCIFELSKMRWDNVNADFSLYGYLKEYVNKKIHLNDIKFPILDKIFIAVASNKFPIYTDIICTMISRSYTLHKVIKQTVFTFSECICNKKPRKVVLIADTIHHIVKYISDTDLLNLAIAFNALSYTEHL